MSFKVSIPLNMSVGGFTGVNLVNKPFGEGAFLQLAAHDEAEMRIQLEKLAERLQDAARSEHDA